MNPHTRRPIPNEIGHDPIGAATLLKEESESGREKTETSTGNWTAGSREDKRINHTTRLLERTGKGQTPKILENALGNALWKVGLDDSPLKASSLHIDAQLNRDLTAQGWVVQ